MAAIALGAVASAMDILNPVAVGARHADFLVALADMARRAGDVAVRAPQRKLRPVMVIGLDAPPCGLAMAAIAGFAKTPFVRILRLVTIEAPSWRIAKLDILQVTADAGHCLVSIPQLEVRHCMIERLAVEQDDVRITPLVIGMTLRAFLLRRVGLAAVKPPGRLAIGGDVLVAGEA